MRVENKTSEIEPVREISATELKDSIVSGKLHAFNVVRPHREAAKGRGPRAALLAAGIIGMNASGKERWIEDARLEALLGNCKSTLTSFRSGVKCYIDFVGRNRVSMNIFVPISLSCCADTCGKRAKYFPPSLDMLLAWSTLFRSRDTFSNYLSYVKTACLCVHAPVQASTVT